MFPDFFDVFRVKVSRSLTASKGNECTLFIKNTVHYTPETKPNKRRYKQTYITHSLITKKLFVVLNFSFKKHSSQKKKKSRTAGMFLPRPNLPFIRLDTDA